jgi:hypothetical protein
MAIAICFGLGCCVLVLSETVLVLERSVADAIIRVLRNINSNPQSNSHQPSKNSIGFSHDKS